MKIKYFNSFNNEINDLILKNYPEFLKEKEPDVLISYGGDGTVLDCFRYLIKENLKIPILVFQGGTFNFLSTKYNENFFNILEKIKNDDIELYEEKFNPIAITFNKSKVWYYALNDIVIGENILSYPEFLINTNDYSLNNLNYKGMGLCISSALGSTGFNLNNNGQIGK